MSIQVRWADSQQTIVLYQYADNWTWAEVYEAMTESKRLLDGDFKDVFFIHDFTNGQTVPKDVFTHGRRFIFEMPENTIVALVGTALLGRMLIDVLSRFSPKFKQQYRLAETVDEAIALIEHEQPSMK